MPTVIARSMILDILAVPQVDGGTRLVAVGAGEGSRVQNDPPLLDRVRVLGAVDVARDGSRRWAPCGPALGAMASVVWSALHTAAFRIH